MAEVTYKSFTGRLPLSITAELTEATMAIDAEARTLCAGLKEEQLSWQPRPGSWSIAENLAHLRTTNQVFLPAVDSALEASRKLKLHGAGPFALNLYGHLMVWGLELRPVLKLQAPQCIQPCLLGSATAELDHFLLSQAALRGRIADADGLNLTAFRFPSPVARCFRVNLLEFFSAFNAHSRRHLRQASNVRRAMPAAIRHNQA